MAKHILRKDAEKSYKFLNDILEELEKTAFRNSQMRAPIYLKAIKTIKGYILDGIYIDSFTEKYMNALPRFEMGYAKIEYLNGNPDYIDTDNNEPCKD